MPDGREPVVASAHHPAVARVRRLRRPSERRAAGVCLAEGPHLVGEALAAGLRPCTVFVTAEYAASGAEAEALVAALRMAEPPAPASPDGLPRGLVVVSARAFAALAATRTPQGILAVLPIPAWPIDDGGGPPPGVTLALDGVQDPGNVGALARALLAFAPSGALLLTGPGTADPFSDKALRASAGALFHLRHAHAAGGLAAGLGRLARAGAGLWALAPRGGTPLPEADLRSPLCLVVGGEGPGVSAQVLAACRLLTVPIAPRTESLGAAVAGAIALYEAARRQRA